MQINQDDNSPSLDEPTSSNRFAIFAIVLVILLSAGGYYYYGDRIFGSPATPKMRITVPEKPFFQTDTAAKQQDDEPVSPVESLATESDVATQGAIDNGDTLDITTDSAVNIEPNVETTDMTKSVPPAPLPSLNQSDEFVLQKVLPLIQGTVLDNRLVQQYILRQLVVFVDNLAQGELARKVSPINGPKSQFPVSEITNKVFLNPNGYQRYDPYVDAITMMSDQQLVGMYRQFSPLLEEAFTELGYGGNITFNERLLSAIQLLLDTPIIEDPIELSSISVNYQFVDPKLEALPSAQKLLIRMGPDNTRKLKSALRKLQRLLMAS